MIWVNNCLQCLFDEIFMLTLGLRKFLVAGSSLEMIKMVKNDFYFMLKTFPVIEIFTF